MTNATRKKPAQRAFTGMAGSPLAAVAEQSLPTQTVPKASKFCTKDMVLLHFCFDQQSGETKKEWCPCKKRVSREAALALVKEDCADWLITRNGRAKSGVSEFHRAIVVRSVLVDGEKLYSVDPPLALDGRKRKHEAIKRDVCDSARRLFQELFAKGVISQTDLQMSDAQLDELFGDAHILDKLLGKLTEVGQNSAHRRMVEITQHWWNNILGFQKLNIDAGRFLADADESSGLIVHVGGSGHLDVVDGQHKIDRGRVQVANHRPSNWSGDWDYSIGSTPAVDEHNDDDPTGGYAERADDHNDDGERGLTVGGRPIDGKATWQGEVIATKDEEWTGHED